MWVWRACCVQLQGDQWWEQGRRVWALVPQLRMEGGCGLPPPPFSMPPPLALAQVRSYWQYDWESPQRAPKPDRSRFSRSMTVVPILSSGESRSKSYSSISRSFSRGMVQLSSNILVGACWRQQSPRPAVTSALPLGHAPPLTWSCDCREQSPDGCCLPVTMPQYSRK